MIEINGKTVTSGGKVYQLGNINSVTVGRGGYTIWGNVLRFVFLWCLVMGGISWTGGRFAGAAACVIGLVGMMGAKYLPAPFVKAALLFDTSSGQVSSVESTDRQAVRRAAARIVAAMQ